MMAFTGFALLCGDLLIMHFWGILSLILFVGSEVDFITCPIQFATVPIYVMTYSCDMLLYLQHRVNASDRFFVRLWEAL